MKVIHVSEKINEFAGGTSIHIANLASATADQAVEAVELVMFDLKHMGRMVETSPKVKVTIIETPKPFLYGRSPDFARCLDEKAREPGTVFHMHNMWRLPMVYGCAAARRHERPSVVSPHGALTPWALTKNALPKKIMWPLLERGRLKHSSLLRATSAPEAEFLSTIVPGTPIAVIPVGTEFPALPEVQPEPEQKTALFLSRITPNKGVLTLLKAWSIIRPKDWRLEIYGPDEGGHLAVCEQAKAELGLGSEVTFRGPAFQEARWKPFLEADLFILPTLSENFGIAIAEALAAALPVITTRCAPWPDLVAHRCGWWIELGAEPLVAAMREAFAMSPAELRPMGARGRELVMSKYSWPAVARQMVRAYEWLLSGGERPEFLWKTS